MRSRFVPVLETMENRLCPSVTVGVQLGNILAVTGDNNANDIVVTDNGTGGITIAIDGGEATAYSGIRTIMLFLRGGNDTVDYTLTNTMLKRMNMLSGLGPGDDTAAFHFNADIASPLMTFGALGSLGHDSVTAEFHDITHADALFGVVMGPDNDVVDVTVSGSVLENSRFALSIDGGLGDDDLTVNALATDVDLDCLLSLEMKGGWGSDEMYTTFGGQVNGTETLALDGGLDNDMIFAEAQMTPTSTGTLAGRVAGRFGDDDLVFNVYSSEAVDATVNAILDGGWGDDSALFIGPVTVRDIDG